MKSEGPRPAPLHDLTGRRLAVVAGKAKPTATHMKPAFSKARRRGRAALVARREGLIRGTVVMEYPAAHAGVTPA